MCNCFLCVSNRNWKAEILCNLKFLNLKVKKVFFFLFFNVFKLHNFFYQVQSGLSEKWGQRKKRQWCTASIFFFLTNFFYSRSLLVYSFWPACCKSAAAKMHGWMLFFYVQPNLYFILSSYLFSWRLNNLFFCGLLPLPPALHCLWYSMYKVEITRTVEWKNSQDTETNLEKCQKNIFQSALTQKSHHRLYLDNSLPCT